MRCPMLATMKTKAQSVKSVLTLDWIVLTAGILMLSSAVFGTVANALNDRVEAGDPAEISADLRAI